MKFLFDIETDGLLDTVSTVHCLVLVDMETGAVQRYTQEGQDLSDGTPITGTIEEGVRLLDTEGDVLLGHNIIDYDLRALRKLYPWAKLMPSRIVDTLVLARLCYPDIKPVDFGCYERWNMPKRLIGSQGLEAWGYRLGLHKIDYKDWCAQNGIENPWGAFTPEMLHYCVGDVELNKRLFNSLSKKKPPLAAVNLEMAYAVIAKEMEENGFPFDMDKAVVLQSTLQQRKTELELQVQDLFDDWWAPVEEVTVTKTRREKTGEGYWRIREKGKTLKADTELLQDEVGSNWRDAHHWFIHEGKAVEFVPTLREFTEGSTYTSIERVSFNPKSRDHIGQRLQVLYGWKPREFGKNGKPVLDDEKLANLPFPPCKLLAEYFLITKRLAQLNDGRQGWMRLAKKSVVHGRENIRVHGQMNTIGTVTFRCSHNRPNMAQVPSVHNAEGVVPYGKECRELFRSETSAIKSESDFVLVGCDASGLQLRALAHNLYGYDAGRYAELVVSGDIHTANMHAAGLDTRDRAKRFIYALLFGAGGWKLGITVGGATPEEIAAAPKKPMQYVLKNLDFAEVPYTPENIAASLKGYALKKNFLARTEGFGGLIADLKAQAKAGWIKGLDGRQVPVRSEHAALNTLLMSDEAIICKTWKVRAHENLIAAGFLPGRDFLVHGDVHDEVQLSARKDAADEIGKVLAASVTQAGVELGYNVALAGEYKVGATWADTH